MTEFAKDCKRLMAEGKPVPVMFLAEQCDKLYEENAKMLRDWSVERDVLTGRIKELSVEIQGYKELLNQQYGELK